MTNSVTVTTFNILHETYAERNKTCLPEGVDVSIARRIPHIVTVLQEAKSDIYCLQECTQETSKAIAKKVRFTAEHVPHQSEGLAIHYNPSRFTLVNSEGIPLNNQKKALIVTLKENTTQRKIRIVTAHLSGGQDRSKGKEELKELKKYISLAPELDTIIAGDFNRDCNEMGELMRNEESKFPSPFQAALAHPEIHTEQACKTNKNKSRRIDHFITNLPVEKETASHGLPFGKLASDHLALSGTFALNTAHAVTPVNCPIERSRETPQLSSSLKPENISKPSDSSRSPLLNKTSPPSSSQQQSPSVFSKILNMLSRIFSCCSRALQSWFSSK